MTALALLFVYQEVVGQRQRIQYEIGNIISMGDLEFPLRERNKGAFCYPEVLDLLEESYTSVFVKLLGLGVQECIHFGIIVS